MISHLYFVSLLTLLNPQNRNTMDTKKRLIEIENEMAEAFNTGHVSKVLSYFDKDIVAISTTNHERLGGVNEYLATFDFYKKNVKEAEYNIYSPLVQEFNDFAIVSFYWVITQLTENGRREVNGRGSHFFRKIDGKWKIVHEHFSRAANN